MPFLFFSNLLKHSVGLLWTRDQQRPLLTQDNATYKHNRHTSMPPARFEPAIPETKTKTYASYRAATGIGSSLQPTFTEGTSGQCLGTFRFELFLSFPLLNVVSPTTLPLLFFCLIHFFSLNRLQTVKDAHLFSTRQSMTTD
jgi:hypothetical protein